MAGTTPIYGFPYPEPSDLVANYPALGQQLAEDVETEIIASGKIKQIVQFTDTTRVSSTSTSFVTTGLTATITPASVSNKILVMAATTGECSNATAHVVYTLFRGTVADTNLGNGASGFFSLYNGSNVLRGPITSIFLDSPNTTSAQVYTMGMRTTNAATAVRAQEDNATGVLILIEVAP